MKTPATYLLLLSVAFLLTGCSAKQNKQLRAHQALLSDFSMGTMPTEDKIDAMATSFVKLMNESLSILDPRKGLAYVKKYHQQNQPAIDTILEEVSDWQSKMNTLDKINFVASMVQKPYTKELVDLVPKFQRKYNQVKFISNAAGKLKEIVTFGK
ncbi:MAG: hypothetical protein AAFO94_18415 [Bacteroidota bacterium]